MGWKGAVRSIAAAQRRAERESRRRQRELEKQRRQVEKMQELERVQYEVEVYENYVEVLMSVHKDCGEVWNWEDIHSSEPPPEPEMTDVFEQEAQGKLDSFKPSLTDKLLRRTNTKLEELTKAIEKARQQDEREYQDALEAYVDWQNLQLLASNILTGEPQAFLNAIGQVNPFSEIGELGSSVSFVCENASLIEAKIKVNGENVIPTETKSVLKSGKLSVKKMPKGKFYELYQDYVCGCVLRVARELFALLPVEMVIVTAEGELLNTKTGYMENQAILSAAMPRGILENLNFDSLDPSDAMGNFLHRMKFKKTKGFDPIKSIEVSDLQSPEEDKKRVAEFRAAKAKQLLKEDDLTSFFREIKGMRSDGLLDEAEGILLTAEPTPAILDELRKISSTKAKMAKKEKNWATVVESLENYDKIAEINRDKCKELVNANPPQHTASDQKLLKMAREELKTTHNRS